MHVHQSSVGITNNHSRSWISMKAHKTALVTVEYHGESLNGSNNHESSLLIIDIDYEAPIPFMNQ